MNVLGIHASFWHDPAAVVVVDGTIVAAMEEERVSRVKHAPHALPVEASRVCLDLAGLKPEQIDLVAYSWSASELSSHRAEYLRRNLFRDPRRTIRSVLRDRRTVRTRMSKLYDTLRLLGIPKNVEVESVEHHLAHAASAFHTSGFEEAAVLSIDGTSDRVTALAADGRGSTLTPRWQLLYPDSLGLFYSTFTDYLGFDINDGEYKVMGMASYGDPDRFDLSDLLSFSGGDVRLDRKSLLVPKRRRWREHAFGARLVDRFGPPRSGDALEPPFPDLAASVQRHFEQAVLHLLETHLGETLAKTRRLCFAGGCALNVALNRKLIALDTVDELFVPPAPHDPGTAVGAVAVALAKRGQTLSPRPSPYLGPGIGDSADIERVLRSQPLPFKRMDDAVVGAAELLSQGEIVAWCQGRMEWGPRALGNRSILGHPGRRGVSDEINTRIKFREPWRPFCPSVLADRAGELFSTEHESPYMTYCFSATEAAKSRVPEVVHVDGTLRPQTVTRRQNARFHDLLSAFAERTGLPCLINTSLNRRGEPMVCSVDDALNMFDGSGLEHLFVGDYYVVKDPARF